MKVENFKRFSLKMLRCEARAFLGRDEFDYWPLAVSMPPTKVCPHCKAAVPVRRKTCERCDHVFRSKRKAECNL